MPRKILITLAVLLLLPVIAVICITRWSQPYLERNAKAAPEPRIVKGEGHFQKRLFYTDDALGNISQILLGWPADKEGARLAVVGNWGAHFLDLTGHLKKQIRFSKFLRGSIEVARMDAAGDYAYLPCDEGWAYPATLFDKDGYVSWSYAGGFLSGVNDSVSGDIYGDGKLSVVIGFNGGEGLALVDGQGKTVWIKKEGNVWHVETLDIYGDGRQEILHSNTRGQLLVRDAKGDIIVQYLAGHYVSDFTLTRWAEEQRPTHILVPTTEDQQGSCQSIFVVLDAGGKTIAQLESPLGDALTQNKATTTRFGTGAEFFAVLQSNTPWKRSMLLLYSEDRQIAYQEILGESCLGIAALPGKDGEQLLIGCTGKIWEYSPAPQTNNGPMRVAPRAARQALTLRNSSASIQRCGCSRRCVCYSKERKLSSREAPAALAEESL